MSFLPASPFSLTAPAPAVPFGAPPAAPTLAPLAAPAFGAPTPAVPAFSLSGAPAPRFGAPAAPAFGAPAAPLFGAPAPAAAAPGLFAPTPVAPAAAPLFGAPAAAPAAAPLFGAPAAAAPAAALPGFGAPPGAGKMGTNDPKFRQVSEHSEGVMIFYNTITAMTEYRAKSLEELRWEDYQIRLNPALAGAAAAPYGAPAPAYGAPAPAYGAPAPAYGAPAPAYGAPAPAYGAPAPAAPLFGAPAAAPAAPLFGAPAAPAAPLFGAPAAAPALGSPFGAPPAAVARPGFGSPSAPAAPLFGVPAAAPAAPLFGAPVAPAAPLFGAPAAPAAPLFGAPAAPANPFGAPAAPAPGVFPSATPPPANPFGTPPAAAPLFGAPAAPAAPLFGAPGAPAAPYFGTPAAPAAAPNPFSPAPATPYAAPGASPLFGGFSLAPTQQQLQQQQPLQATITSEPFGPQVDFSGLRKAAEAPLASPSVAVTGAGSPAPGTTPLRTSSSALKARSLLPRSAAKVKPRLLFTEPAQPPAASVAANAALFTDIFHSSESLKKLVIEPLPEPGPPEPPPALPSSSPHPTPWEGASSVALVGGTLDVSAIQPAHEPELLPGGPASQELIPRLTNPEYRITPPISELEKMSERELARVPKVRVEEVGRGCVEFLGSVDVRGAVIDEVIKFGNGEVIVYGPDDAAKPAPGTKMNCPAIVTLYGCRPRKTDDAAVARYRSVLQKATQKFGGRFIGYDAQTGNWSFELQHF